jgi:CRP/FNR family transcriptional regulator, cyclic AMP receptor protein
LKDPVSWRFSALTNTRAPTRRESSPAGSSGVSRTRPAILRAAPSTSSMLTVAGATAITSGIIRLVATGDETARLLARTEVFSDLEQRELEAVAQVAVPRTWERGQIIFREGDEGDTCYLLRSGAVVLTREHQDGRMVALAELRAGAMFGELAMFRGETRSATAEAVETTTAVALLARDVQRLIRRHPELALKVLASLAERVSRTNERLLQQSFQTVAGRVASALLAQTVSRQAEGAPDADVLIRATQAEIAHLAGTSRESASRFLATLERAGVVTLGRGKVTVHDPTRLRNYIH